jgi:hypothetical protein
VVFPDPFGPEIPILSPELTEREKDLITGER